MYFHAPCGIVLYILCLYMVKFYKNKPQGVLIFRIGCSGYFFGFKMQKLFLLGQQIIQLLFWVHEMPNFFLILNV